MDKQNQLWFFFQFLQEVEKELSKEEEKQVMIEKAINLKLMCDYVVSCSYSDIVLIICMLRDYVKMLDEVRSDISFSETGLWVRYYPRHPARCGKRNHKKSQCREYRRTESR